MWVLGEEGRERGERSSRGAKEGRTRVGSKAFEGKGGSGSVG